MNDLSYATCIKRKLSLDPIPFKKSRLSAVDDKMQNKFNHLNTLTIIVASPDDMHISKKHLINSIGQGPLTCLHNIQYNHSKRTTSVAG